MEAMMLSVEERKKEFEDNCEKIQKEKALFEKHGNPFVNTEKALAYMLAKIKELKIEFVFVRNCLQTLSFFLLLITL